MRESDCKYWRKSSSSKGPETNLSDFSSQKPIASMESMTDASSVPIFAGPFVPMNCSTNLAWPGKTERGGKAMLAPNMTEEKMKHVTRKRDPTLDRGTSFGEDGCSSSTSSSFG